MHFIRRKKERLFRVQDKVLVNCMFQIQKYRNDGAITYNGPWFNNLILDVGLDALAVDCLGHSIGSLCGYVNVGDDNTDPAIGQTGLLSFVAATNTFYGTISEGYSTDDPIHRWSQHTHEFAVGECTGNLTEVSLSKGSNSTHFNRQLFKDEAGDPTTITVLEDEGLRITSRVYVYGDLQPGDTENSSFTLTTDSGDETINVTREITSTTDWLEYNAAAGQIAALGYSSDRYGAALTSSTTSFDVGGGTNPDTTSGLDYTTGDFYKDYEHTWNAGTFVGDIESILMPYYPSLSSYQGEDFTAFRLNPAISLAETEEFRVTLRRAWGRYAA